MSKKYLLGLLALATLPTVAVAQLRPAKQLINRAALHGARPVKMTAPVPELAAPRRSGNPTTPPAPAAVPQPASWGTAVGYTTYDLQTNRSVGNRIAMTNDTLSLTWTQTCQLGSAPNYSNRGIGYNLSTNSGQTFANGAGGSCPDTFGIAQVRTGWPEVVHSNGQEVVFAHTLSGIVKASRPLGTGAWTNSAILPFSANIDGPTSRANGTWPRVVASGSTIHMVYVDNITGNVDQPQLPSGIIDPVLYNRSQDGGLTWDRTNINLPQFDSTNFKSVGGDNSAVAANGQNVAVTAGSFGGNTLIAKSIDNGTTFTTTRIAGPWTDADTIRIGRPGSDTAAVVASDGSVSLVIDNAGTVHWFSGGDLIQVARNAATGLYESTGSYYPDRFQGLLYWNDRELSGAKPVVVASLEDFVPAGASFDTLVAGNYANGGPQPYSVTGTVSMPSAVTDASGDVYCIYASGVKGTSNSGLLGGQYYRDLYLLKLGFPGGGLVEAFTPKNISRDLRGIPDGAASTSEESVYPSAVHQVMNGKIHYLWMSDFEPGNALNPSASPDPEVENAIMYDAIDVPAVSWTRAFMVTNVKQDVAAYVNAASAAPNPTTGITTLHLDLKQATMATITVRNVLGREVAKVPTTALLPGANAVKLDLSGLSNGVYFYTVKGDKFTLTQRLVKN